MNIISFYLFFNCFLFGTFCAISISFHLREKQNFFEALNIVNEQILAVQKFWISFCPTFDSYRSLIKLTVVKVDNGSSQDAITFHEHFLRFCSAKINKQNETNFSIFFTVIKNFSSASSLRCQGTSSWFDNRLLHSFSCNGGVLLILNM